MEQTVDRPASRQHPRVPLRMPVFCESPAITGYRTVGLTQNVSRGGLLLEVPQALAPDTPTRLLLLMGDRNARAEGAVVWTAEDPPSRMGLKFTMMTEADRLAWEQLLDLQAGPKSRASVRIPMVLDVTCRDQPDTTLPGRIENLSDGGLLLVLSQDLSPQTQLTVTVPPWLTLPSVEAAMEVVWTRSAPEGDGVLHGLRFRADDIGKELFLIGTLLRQIVASDEETPGGTAEGIWAKDPDEGGWSEGGE